MNFLKEMIARTAQAPRSDTHEIADRQVPTAVETGQMAPFDPEWDYDGGESDTAAQTTESLDQPSEPASIDADTNHQGSGLPAHDPDALDTADENSWAAKAPMDEEADDIPTDRGLVNIWELGDEQEIAAISDTDLAGTAMDMDAPAELSENELARRALEMLQARAPEDGVANPAPTRKGRAKTRLLGFRSSNDVGNDVFDETSSSPKPQSNRFPVGWLVVTDGPGRGASFALYAGVSQIGRSEDQAIALNFGDTAISRANHAAIAYDEEQNAFFVGHGGKANIVRLNGQPILSTEVLNNADLIRIGVTTLRFVALCGAEFGWGADDAHEVGIV